MRQAVLLLLLFAVGCSCEIREPFLKLHKEFLQKTYNWVPADNEASKYRDREEAARAYLQEQRAVLNPYAISTRLKDDGFHWHKESFDFTSYDWVTVARKRGDCDDFMVLWESILKYQGDVIRVTVRSTEGRGHAMLLFYPKGSGHVYLLSNVGVRGMAPKGEEDALIRLFYGEKTDCYVTYKGIE